VRDTLCVCERSRDPLDAVVGTLVRVHGANVLDQHVDERMLGRRRQEAGSGSRNQGPRGGETLPRAIGWVIGVGGFGQAELVGALCTGSTILYA
jgi:hypothetical protein